MSDLICMIGGELVLSEEAQGELIAIEKTIKALKERQEELKGTLLMEMEELGLRKFETDALTLTYIAETERETFNSARLKKEDPDTYNKYADLSKVKASIRVKIHEK